MFAIDPSSSEFAPYTNLSEDKVKIELWARAGMGASLIGTKGKQNSETDSLPSALGWKRLNEWFVALSELVPLPDEVCKLLYNVCRLTWLTLQSWKIGSPIYHQTPWL